MKRPTMNDYEVIEAIIDRTSLSGVVFILGEICLDKGAHIRMNWQDKKTASAWEKLGRQFETLSSKLNRVGF